MYSEIGLRRQTSLLLALAWLSGCSSDATLRSAQIESDAAPRPESDAAESAGDAPAAADAVTGCPLHVSVTTSSYGTGNHDDDDYAPNNVGAIWITTASGSFVRTIAVWGPTYWEFATNWVQQAKGSRVDVMTAATRKNHDKPVEASWDCRDKSLQLVAAGSYYLNAEFAETEEVSRVLTGAMALAFEIGASADAVAREPGAGFGRIELRFSRQ